MTSPVLTPPAAATASVDRLLTEEELMEWYGQHYEAIRKVAEALRELERSFMADAVFMTRCEFELGYAGIKEERVAMTATLPVVPDAHLRLPIVAKVILSDPSRFDMSRWHSKCGTTHCIGGWATHLAGNFGKVLEGQRGSALVAATCLLGLEAASHFFDDQVDALVFLMQYED
jgi:hypothetical protein